MNNGERLDMSKFSMIRFDEVGREYVVYLPTGQRFLLDRKQPKKAARADQVRSEKPKPVAGQFEFDIPTWMVTPSVPPIPHRGRAYYVEGSGNGLD